MSSDQRKASMIGVAVVAMAVAGWMFYRNSAGSAVQIPNRATIHGACLSCKANGTIEVPMGTADPFDCPSCKTRAFYPSFYCADCQMRFVPTLSRVEAGGALRVPMTVRCPKCSGMNVSAFDPEFVTPEILKGDLPLPKWEP